MAEPPDFEHVAKRALAAWRINRGRGGITLETMMAEQLRLIWNARGAADIATIDRDLSAMAGSYAKYVDHLLRKLDRSK